MPNPEPSLNRDETCELLVVGGGFTGLWAALQAKERKPDADIILVEQTFIGDGASGRNGGFLSSSIAHGETNIEAQFPGEEEKLDALGRQNITAFNLNLSAWPVPKKVKAAIAHHTFWLTDDKDALYNVGGAAGRRDPTGSSGTEVGNEMDITVVWKIDHHQAVLFGWSHFWENDFIQQTGISEDADLFYIQYAFKF